MNEQTSLFLDYGELIFNYDFNKTTLLKAHKLALDYINSRNGYKLDLGKLTKAHDKSIGTYLKARQDNSEWAMDKIMGIMLVDLGLNKKMVPDISEIYKLNDHNSTPMDSTLEALPELAKTKKLGIISNLPHNSLIYELKKYDLLKFFDTITISYQVGFRKPHPKIYQEAIKRAKIKPEESIFASHDEKEVIGAERSGMKAFLAKSLDEVIGALT